MIILGIIQMAQKETIQYYIKNHLFKSRYMIKKQEKKWKQF